MDEFDQIFPMLGTLCVLARHLGDALSLILYDIGRKLREGYIEREIYLSRSYSPHETLEFRKTAFEMLALLKPPEKNLRTEKSWTFQVRYHLRSQLQ